MNADSPNPFRRFWELGYKRLLPVIPATENIRNAGKRPGQNDGNGWYGRGCKTYNATEALLDIWKSMGAGVGLRADDGVAGIDIDTLNPKWAKHVTDLAFSMFGETAVRIGQEPKTLLLYRVDPDTQYRQLAFNDGSPPVIDKHGKEKPAKAALIELQAGDAKWFVVYGTHPKTQRPYRWPVGLWERAKLPFVSAEQLDAFYARLRDDLPTSLRSASAATSVDRATVDQETLKGDPALIVDAVRATPNDTGRIGYDEWMRMAAALRGAFQDDYDLGLDLFVEWTEKAGIAEPEEDPERAYKSLIPPFGLGADYICSQAEAAGWQTRIATQNFEIPVSADDAQKIEYPPVRISATPLRRFDAATLPRRQWLYGDHYIRKYVSTTAAPTAVGKSSLIMVEAMAMVVGKPLLGIEPKGCFRVWVWNGEDPIEELELRMAAIMQHYGVTHEDLGGRLFLNSGRNTEIVVATAARDGAKIAVPVVASVVATLRANTIDVGVLDPFVSTYRGPETNDMFDPIVKQWGVVAGATNTAIELVHHTRKLNGSEATVEDTRGGGALIAGARSKRVLARMSVAEAKKFGVGEDQHRRYFRIADASVNMAFPAILATQWFEMQSVAIGNGEGPTSVDRMMSGDSVGVATLRVLDTVGATVGQNDKALALDLIRAGEWRRDVRAGDAWIGVPIAQALGLDIEDGAGKASVRQIVGEWLKSGLLKEVSRKDAGRKIRTYVECDATYVAQNGAANGVFE